MTTAAVSVGGAGELAMWLAGVATAVGVLARQRPVRWLGRTLVKDPVMAAFRREVAEIVDERLDARPLTNGVGWQTVRAIAEHLGIEVDDRHHDDTALGREPHRVAH